MIRKIFKFIGIVFSTFLLLVVMVCSGIILYGSNFETFKEKDFKYDNWMSNIDDNTLVNEIIMPGSHDAGSYGMMWLGETQQFNIEQQLKMGVRYFDLRVKKKDDKFIIFHNIIEGVEFLPILNSIKEFVISNPTETLLLDFQHFDGGSQNDVYNFITEYLYNDNLLVINDTTLTDLEFINNLKLKDSRGKCIIFWGDRSNDSSNYIFLRNNDDCSWDEMSLNSMYITEFHTKEYEFLKEYGHLVYFENIKNKINKEGKGFFILQAQLTDKLLVFGPYSRERQYDSYISEDIISYKGSDNLKYLNIIMRDYLTYDKCEEIISLNIYKNGME